jgi:hypothetical protein
MQPTACPEPAEGARAVRKQEQVPPGTAEKPLAWNGYPCSLGASEPVVNEGNGDITTIDASAAGCACLVQSGRF